MRACRGWPLPLTWPWPLRMAAIWPSVWSSRSWSMAETTSAGVWRICQDASGTGSTRFEISNGLPGAFNSSTRLLPGNSPVDRTNTATNDPAPSLHPRYRGFSTTTSRSAGVPGDGTQSLTGSPLGTLPVTCPRAGGVRARLLFRAEAADRARVVSMPDTAWPVSGHPPDSSRDHPYIPVLMSPVRFSTRQQRFACARLPDPHLTDHVRLFLIAHDHGLQ